MSGVEKDDDGSVAEMFAEFAMRLHNEPTVEQTVESIVRFALQAVGCDHASLVLARHGRHLEVAAVTDPLAEQAIRTQLDCGQGPCLAGIADRVSVLVPDTLTDQRWPTWAASMVELGLRSVLTVRVHADDAATGALNLIAEKPDAFGHDEEATAHILAQHASIALATAQQTTTLSIAVDARNTIGQAQGILMERYSLTSDQAFHVLRRYSQQNNLKLNAVARHLITTRKLPDSPRTEERRVRCSMDRIVGKVAEPRPLPIDDVEMCGGVPPGQAQAVQPPMPPPERPGPRDPPAPPLPPEPTEPPNPTNPLPSPGPIREHT